MATNLGNKLFTPVTRQLEEIRAELPKGASVSHVIALLHIFDICGQSGITAKDIEVLTGESAPTVSRMLKSFNENYGLISYQQLSLPGPKIIMLTEKGAALKQRVLQAKQDYDRTAQLQQSIVDENIRNRLKREQAAEQKDIQTHHSAQNLGLLGKAGQVKITSDKAEMIKSDRELRQIERQNLFNNFNKLRGSSLVRKVKELNAGQSQYIFDQINRAKSRAVKKGQNNFTWRGHNIKVLSPTSGYELRDELKREMFNGIWFYYLKDEEPSKNLPLGIQRDFSKPEFDSFMSDIISDINAHLIIGVSEVTFSSVMKDTRRMLNTLQYKKARDLATRAVAEIANTIEKAKIASDKEIIEAEHTARALHSLAKDPKLSEDDRDQFQYDAYGADRQAAQIRKGNESLQKALAEQQNQINHLKRLMEEMIDKKE